MPIYSASSWRGSTGAGYKQSLVRSLVTFACTVELHVIGEGVDVPAPY